MKRWLGMAYVHVVVWVLALFLRDIHPSMGVRRVLLMASLTEPESAKRRRRERERQAMAKRAVAEFIQRVQR